MSDEPVGEDHESYLEIQMDRSTIVLAAVALVALLAGAFLLGSWFGSRGSKGDGAAAASAQEAAAPDDATAAGHDGEDVSAEEGFGGKPVSARGAPPVGAVPPPAPTTTPVAPRIEDVAAATAPRASAPARRAATAPARASAAPSKPTVAAPVPAGSWIVQVAAVKERREADQLAERLRKKGYPVRVLEDAGFLKVQVGPYSSKADAQAAERRLKSQERQNTWLKPA